MYRVCFVCSPFDRNNQNEMTFCLASPMRPAAYDEVCCKAALPNGSQCHFVAEDGSEYCRKHRHLTQRTRFRYKTSTPLPRIPPSQLFDLTAEVELLKGLIAQRAQMLVDPDSVLLYSGHIAQLIAQMQKLMDGAIKLEQAKQNLLSRDAAMRLIGDIIDVVAAVVDDIDKIDQIHERIEQLLTNLERDPT